MGLRSISRTMSFRLQLSLSYWKARILDSFEISLDWSQIGDSRQPYRVVALIRTRQPAMKRSPTLTSKRNASVRATAGRRLPAH